MDCGDLGNCAIPMWFQYIIVLAAFIVLVGPHLGRRDPYDRR